MKEKTADNRIFAFDMLRVVAAFSVVLLHCAAQFWYSGDVKSAEWISANAIDSVSCFGVPVFIMISGALFLADDKKTDIKRLYLHNALRILIVYIVWSIIYGFFDLTRFDFSKLTVHDYILEFVSGRYHLWYLLMIFGMYIATPFIKKMVNALTDKELVLFIVIYFIYQIGITTLLAIKDSYIMMNTFGAFSLPVLSGYVGYYVLGYALCKYPVRGKKEIILYLSAVLGVFLNIGLSTYKSLQNGVANKEIYDAFSIGTFLIAVAVFNLAVNHTKEERLPKAFQWLIREVSRSTLGIYMIHLLIIEFVTERSGISINLPVFLYIILLAVFSYIVGFVIMGLIRRIPYVGRYIC